MSTITKLADRAQQGLTTQKIVDQINEAHAAERISAIMVVYFDPDGFMNLGWSTQPSTTRAVGALEQLKHDLLET